ncbi:hypothetical protein GH714_040237 [Hevea brasiliensis]|uniref:Uncharacterized protein n=1 Tax=Hevea brasiliensis TaxID=3981 RepID=A0A6A6MTG5_HEVBR|nr:hypothetical protein GH714_040237 [Hevea brasiliensis]
MTTQRKNICVNESYDCNLEEWLIKHNTDARWSSKHHTWNLDPAKASINWNLEWLTLDTVQLVQGMITAVIEFHDKNGIHGYLHNHKNFLLKFGMKCYLGARAELEIMSLLHDTNGLEVRISDATFSSLCRAVLVLLSLNHYIEKIPEIQIRALETFLNGMWQLTESSSSATSPSSWVESNKSSSTEDDEADNNKQMVIAASSRWVKSEKKWFIWKKDRGNEEEMGPLIQLQDGGNDNWEVLLDASLNLPSIPILSTTTR